MARAGDLRFDFIVYKYFYVTRIDKSVNVCDLKAYMSEFSYIFTAKISEKSPLQCIPAFVFFSFDFVLLNTAIVPASVVEGSGE